MLRWYPAGRPLAVDACRSEAHTMTTRVPNNEDHVNTSALELAQSRLEELCANPSVSIPQQADHRFRGMPITASTCEEMGIRL